MAENLRAHAVETLSKAHGIKLEGYVDSDGNDLTTHQDSDPHSFSRLTADVQKHHAGPGRVIEQMFKGLGR